MSQTAASAHPSRASIVLAFAAVYIIWGSTYLAIRYSVETIPPFFLAGCRFIIAGGGLYFITRARGAAPPTRRHWVAAATVGALLLSLGNGALCWAEQRVPSGLAALLLATIPIWMVVLDSLRQGGAKLYGQVVGGMATGVAGLALLVVPAHLWGSSRVNLPGAGVLMFGSFCWSLGSILSHKLELPASSFLAAAMEMLAGGALLLLLGIVTGEGRHFHLLGVAPRSLIGLLYLIGFGSLLGFTAYIWLLRAVPTARLSTYAFVNPAVAVFLGWALGNELLTGRELLASVTIIAGVAIIITHRPSPLALAPDTEGISSPSKDATVGRLGG